MELLSRTTGDIGQFLQPLEDAIRQQFLPALTGRSQPGDTERELMALPARHGGLGIPNPTQMTSNLEGSVRASEPLSELIQAQTAAL